MLAQIADLRVLALMSLRPYDPVPLCPVRSALCLRTNVVGCTIWFLTISNFRDSWEFWKLKFNVLPRLQPISTGTQQRTYSAKIQHNSFKSLRNS